MGKDEGGRVAKDNISLYNPVVSLSMFTRRGPAQTVLQGQYKIYNKVNQVNVEDWLVTRQSSSSLSHKGVPKAERVDPKIHRLSQIIKDVVTNYKRVSRNREFVGPAGVAGMWINREGPYGNRGSQKGLVGSRKLIKGGQFPSQDGRLYIVH